jgi:hypothetical protein
MSELTEFEEEIAEYVYQYANEKSYLMENFIQDLRKIMPPTCTPNERKFLDTLKESKSLMMTVFTAEGIESYNVDFEKMIEGEDE